MMSPPRPPSPPSGPPMGTNFSRRNELAPDPPVPASTRTTTRSMNTISEPHARSLSQDSREQLMVPARVVGTEQVGDDVDGVQHFFRRGAGMTRPVQMRVQLTVLPRHRARAHDAELT